MAKDKTHGGEPEPDPVVPDPSSEGEDDAKVEMTSGAKERTEVIQHITKLCGFAEDSVMVSYIDQEQWENIFDVVTHWFRQIDEFNVIRDNGKFDAKPMLKDRRMLKCFLLFYRKKFNGLSTTLTDDNQLIRSNRGISIAS